MFKMWRRGCVPLVAVMMILIGTMSVRAGADFDTVVLSRVSTALKSFVDTHQLHADIKDMTEKGNYKTIGLAYKTRMFTLHGRSIGFGDKGWLDEMHEELGPDIGGFIVRVQARPGTYGLPMPLGNDGVSSELVERHPYWSDHYYAIRLPGEIVTVTLSYYDADRLRLPQQHEVETLLSDVKKRILDSVSDLITPTQPSSPYRDPQGEFPY